MSRVISFRYEDPDSTELWNNMFRGMIPSGVYKGFAVSPGAGGGWWLKFTHETDPDNAGRKLGKLQTRDGATVHENADQDNVCVGSVAAGLPNIHYVIASYTYNASTPVNDVVYSVRQGTAGTPPTPPVLGEDEHLLAEIYVPLGAANYSAAGVQIRNVAHQVLGFTPSALSPSKLLNLPAGIYYEGVYPYAGSAWNKVSLKAGRWVCYNNYTVPVPADLPDQFTPTDPGAGFYRFAWIIGAYKWQDTNPLPTADYLLVEGTPVAFGTEASLPTATAVRTAVAALNAKYDDDGDGLAEVQYVNYLGSIRVENRAGTYFVNYYRGETYLDRDTIHVYSSEATAFYRSGKYWGEAGLRQAVEDVWNVTKDRYPLRRPYTLLLDGDFQLSDASLVLPSNLRLLGDGAPARLRSNATDVVALEGQYVGYNGINDTITQSTPVIPDTPAGYQDREFAIQATYQVGSTLPLRRFSKGDRVIISCAAPAYTGEGIFVSTEGDWTFRLWVPDSYNTAGNPTNITFWLMKQNSAVENVEVDNISTGNGTLRMAYLSKCGADRVTCRKFSIASVYDSVFGALRVTAEATWGSPATYPTPLGLWGRNLYQHLHFDVPMTVGALTESRSVYEHLTVQGGGCILTMTDTLITDLSVPDGNLELGAGTTDLTIIKGPTVTTDTAASHTNRVLISPTASWQLAENANSDRNLKMVSDALWSWDSVTGVLSWNDSVKFDNPWTTGYSVLASGNATLSTDGDRLYVDIVRTATGSSAIVSGVRAKAAAASDRYAHHRVFVAVRYGTTLYLWDGTRIESGQSIKLGQTPPPDGSVSWVKLAADAKEFHNRFFRDYVVVDDTVNALLDVDIVFRNAGLATFTYTMGTGIIQYSAPVDLSLVHPGDYLIIREQDYNPAVGGKKGYTFEQILSVNDAADQVTIRKGLDVTVGAGNLWNGSIGRGGKVLTNDSLVTYSYDADGANPGRVTYSTPMGFSQYQVRAGYVWLDSAGNKYIILDRDTTGTGSWITIAPHLRTVITTAPTSKHHGSIETNYNPHRIPVADLRTPVGGEFVPVGVSMEQDFSAQDLIRQYTTLGTRQQCCYTEPYDPRVRVYLPGGSTYENALVLAPSVARMYEPLVTNNVVVEFTGWCTGAILMLADCGASAGGQRMWVDGEDLGTGGWGKDECVGSTVYGVAFNRHQPGINSAATLTSRAYDLPPGVHCIQWAVAGTSFASGIFVLNQPAQNDLTRRYWDVPGMAVQDGKVRSYSGTYQTAMPSSDQAWDKGGRVLRYLDKNGSRQWAARWIRGHSGQGDTSVGSADVSEVTNPSSWMIGDLVMFVDSGTKYVRCITNKVVDVLTLDNTLPFTSTATTFYYYGTSFAGSGPKVGGDTTGEEVARYIPTLEFATPGPLVSNYSAGVKETTDPRQAWIVNLSDAETTLVSTGADFAQSKGSLLFDTNGAAANFTFVGSGLSVIYGQVASHLEVWIDGAYCGLLPATVSSPPTYSLSVGSFLCGELPYGTHTVRFVAQAGIAAYITAFYIWQPKLPVVPAAHQPALEVMDTNLVADDRRATVTAVSSTVELPTLGTVSQEGMAVCCPYSPGGNNPFEDALYGILTSVHGVAMGWAAAGGVVIDSSLAFAFVGDAITLSTPAVNIGIGGNIYVEFMDHDGNWKVPSALTGFTVTGIDGWAASALAFGRYRWTSSKLGLHLVRFRSANAAQSIPVDAIEVHSPYHVHRSQKPYALRHWLPFQMHGADRRNITPFNADLVPRDEVLVSAALLNSVGVAPDNQEPFWFYSLGGPVELRVSGFASTVGGWVLQGTLDGTDTIAGLQDGYTGDTQIHWAATVNLAPGFHFIYLKCSNVSFLNYLSWSARATRQSNLSSRTRGLSIPTSGSMGSREASY